jgi:hypothetical protein
MGVNVAGLPPFSKLNKVEKKPLFPQLKENKDADNMSKDRATIYWVAAGTE